MSGYINANKSLGIQKMPDGYDLMTDTDRAHYFWIRYDGVESVIDCDKWAAYRGAKEDSKKLKGE
jgi:hypothetical protein